MATSPHFINYTEETIISKKIFEEKIKKLFIIRTFYNVLVNWTCASFIQNDAFIKPYL